MITLITIGDAFTGAGISISGSTTLFGLFIVIIVLVIMLLLNMPLPFTMSIMCILSIAVGSLLGSSTLQIIWVIAAVIFGAIAGLSVLRFFNTSVDQ